MGSSPWGSKESDATAWLTHTHTHTHRHTHTHTHQCSAHKHQGPCLVPFVLDNLPKALLAVPASGDQVGCLGPGALLNGLE